jgi:hypothetical protein
MGEWNDRPSLRPGETLRNQKRYSNLGTNPVIGKGNSKRMQKLNQVSPLSRREGGGLAQHGSMIMNENY